MISIEKGLELCFGTLRQTTKVNPDITIKCHTKPHKSLIEIALARLESRIRAEIKQECVSFGIQFPHEFDHPRNLPPEDIRIPVIDSLRLKEKEEIR